MTLDELRIELIDGVRNCAGPHAVTRLIVDAERRLNASRIGEKARRAFWDAVDHDLVVVTQEASMILGRRSAESLRTSIDEARAVLFTYRGAPSSGSR
jgi:hypothetical protein